MGQIRKFCDQNGVTVSWENELPSGGILEQTLREFHEQTHANKELFIRIKSAQVKSLSDDDNGNRNLSRMRDMEEIIWIRRDRRGEGYNVSVYQGDALTGGNIIPFGLAIRGFCIGFGIYGNVKLVRNHRRDTANARRAQAVLDGLKLEVEQQNSAGARNQADMSRTLNDGAPEQPGSMFSREHESSGLDEDKSGEHTPLLKADADKPVDDALAAKYDTSLETNRLGK